MRAASQTKPLAWQLLCRLAWTHGHEADTSNDALELRVGARMAVGGESAIDVEQRAEGEFLRKLVGELQPMLRDSLRSHRIVLAHDSYGQFALESDGGFVHVDSASQQDVLDPLEVLRAEPSLLAILNRIEADLIAAGDPRATRAADIVRLARHSLEVAAAPT